MNHLEIDITTCTELYRIFNEKRWTENALNNNVFKNFCSLLSSLSIEEKKLILELTDQYQWINANMYLSKLCRILGQIGDEKLIGIKKIFIFPVMKPSDDEKIKSGDIVAYMVKPLIPVLKEKYKNINFSVKYHFKDISQNKFILKKNELIFLFDDYLGSGDTIDQCIKEIKKNDSITNDKIHVFSIMAQNESIKCLNNLNIALYYDTLSIKGISDKYQGEKLQKNINIMKNIEKNIPSNSMPFGYNKSEALATLIRTPNNTFPIFWKGYKKGEELIESPFPR